MKPPLSSNCVMMEEDIELYVCSYDSAKLHIYTSSNTTEIRLCFLPHAIAFIGDTSLYAIGGHNPPTLEIRRKDNNEFMRNIHVRSHVFSLAASPDGLQLCVGMDDRLLLFHVETLFTLSQQCLSGMISVYNITEESSTVVFENKGRHTQPVYGCAFTDGVLVTCGGNILIWDTSNCL